MSTSSAFALALAIGSGVAAPARAQTGHATAMTILTGRADPRDGAVHTVVPAYENLWVTARDLAIDGVTDTRVVVAGWAMVAGGDLVDGDRFTGDLDLAFAEGKLFDRRLA